MKILITGITGFVGSHLAEYIIDLNQRHRVYGLCRWRSPRDNLKGIFNKITALEGDLCDITSRKINSTRNWPKDLLKYGACRINVNKVTLHKVTSYT